MSGAAVVAIALLVAAATAASGAAELHDPAADYVMHCRGCHGPDGEGAPGGAPDLRGQVARFLAVPGGRTYLIRVPGTAQSELDDARTAALLTWMMHTFGPADLAAAAPPFTAAEVAAHRREPLLDAAAVRAELIEKLDGGRE